MSTNIASKGYDNGPSPSRYGQQQGGYYGGQNGTPQKARHGNRMASDPQFYNQQRPYQQPQHGYHQSHDTVHTNGSDSTGPWANSTDPSSENSSIDKVNAMNKTPAEIYAAHNQNQNQNQAQNGYNGPIMEEQGQGEYPYQRGYGQKGPPQQNGGFNGPRDGYPRHNTAPSDGPRRPMQLNSGPQPPGGQLPASTRPEEEKRKSWLMRKFSKKE